LKNLHDWNLDHAHAAELQETLRKRLILTWDRREIATVAGLDVHFEGERACAAIVVLSYPELDLVEEATATARLALPYIPGLLAFREGPALVSAWKRLEHTPDLLMFDGQGIAHPRGIGIASHMGLWFERPSIGAAKSRLVGRYHEPGSNRGDSSDLYEEREVGKVIGAVLRTRADVRPLFISSGHLIDLSQSLRFVMSCCTRYRLPEPTRRAHKLASKRR
jgi:deoxyribonuclease V